MFDATQEATRSRVVVGIDDSEEARAALRGAAAVAKLMNWELSVVHAAGDRHGALADVLQSHEFTQAVQIATEETVQAIVAEVLGSQPEVDVTLNVQEGPAADILLEASLGARLLVVGSHAHRGLGGLTIGSVTNACVHRAPCPVLVMRPDLVGEAEAVDANLADDAGGPDLPGEL